MPIHKIGPTDSSVQLKLNEGIGETMALTEPSTQLQLLGNDEGEGILYLTSHRVIWINTQTGTGYSFDYPFISLHAISRDTAHYPHSCIYCQLESGFDDTIDLYENPDSIPEMRFIPQNSAHLESIFRVFSEMSALNPDPQNQDESDEDDDSLEDEITENLEQQNGNYWVPPLSNDGEMDDVSDSIVP